MNIEKIFLIIVLILGIYFWGAFFLSAGKQLKENKPNKKEKKSIVLFVVILCFFLMGSVLWDTKLHDLGVIIQTLSVIAFIWWGFKGDKNENNK